MSIPRLFRRTLAREVHDWVAEGVIRKEQGEAILARYGLSDGQGSAVGYFVLTALAGLFAGLALILLLAHNWDEIPRVVRMLGLIALTLGLNLTGAVQLLRGRERAGVLWLFVGALSYGAAIMLIAQIYHLGEHYPDGIFWWALGVLPLLFITRSRLMALLVLVLATLWMFTEANTGFFPASYPLFALASLWLVWTQKYSQLLFLAALAALLVWFNLLLAWGVGGGQRYDFFADQLLLTLALGVLLSGLACWLMRRAQPRQRDYGQLLQRCLLWGSVLLLLCISNSDFWRAALEERYLLAVFNPLLLALATLAGSLLGRPSGRDAVLPLLVLGGFFTLAALCVQQQWLTPLILALATNLLLVVIGIWLIWRGIEVSEGDLFHTGITVLLLTALLRYFDLIGDYIGGAFLFTLAAGVLLGAARYWRRRLQEGTDHV